MEETEQKFEEMWGGHEEKLVQCLKLRKFEEDFKEVSPCSRIGIFNQITLENTSSGPIS